MFLKAKNWMGLAFATVTVSMLATGCGGSGSQQGELDTPTRGEIHISVDKTYQPLLESEIRVFQSQYPNAKIIADYKPEAECFKDLFDDSARLIIVTRELKENELEYFKKEKIRPQSGKLATDAIALIVNHNNSDSILTMDQVREIMNGKAQKKWNIVFDDQNSSTVRFILDSINKGQPLPPNTMAAKSNKEVQAHVEKDKDAIGVIGVNWISDTNDSTTIEFSSRVTTVKLRGDGYTDFVKPYQYYIGTKSYPLTRGMYYILKEPRQGLGSGFVTFLSSQPGQLVIGKFKLFPARLNIVFREATLTE